MASAAAASSSKDVSLPDSVEKLLAKLSGAADVTCYQMTDADVSLGLPLGFFNKAEEDESSVSKDDVLVNDRRTKSDLISADLAKPFGAPKTLGKLLSETMDDVLRTELGSLVAPRRGWWVAKQDDDEVTLKVPMPGLEKEHVEVRAEKSVVVIKGEGHKGTEDDKEEEPSYSYRIKLNAYAFKMNQVRAAMKNGLLTVTVPKLKEEERKDVFVVNVE